MSEPTCTLKSLPAYELVAAARTAVNENPVNASNPITVLTALAEVVDSVQLTIISPQRIAVLVSKYWGPAARQLTVSFLDNPDVLLRKRILGHMNAWQCCISFAETSRNGQVRIARAEDGYWSYLGTDILHIAADRPTMNLGGFTMQTPESEFSRIVRHETGHTLGAPHEHMRSDLVARIDKNKAIAYFGETQGWNRQTVMDQVLTALSEKSLMGTPVDQDSIMCYQLPGSITKDGRPILGGEDINATDYAFMAKIYPLAVPLPPVPPAPPSPPPGPLVPPTGRAATYMTVSDQGGVTMQRYQLTKL